MNDVYVCEHYGALYAAFVFKDKSKPYYCDMLRRDRPGIDGVCRGELTEFGRLEPWNCL